MTNQSVLFWAMADALRPPSFFKLLEIFGTLENIPKQLSPDELVSFGIPKRTADGISQKIMSVNLNTANEIMTKRNISVISFQDAAFPLALRNISDPPLFLFYCGDISSIPLRNVAVVGTRSPSPDGAYAVQKIIPPLAQAGVGIVSGMAMGIDTLAHKEALANNGKTIAFLGSGLNVIYPSSNTSLFQKIITDGVVFSEFPLGTKPEPYNFPRRNRLVSGLSDGVLVVEGKIKSGSLITADFAMEQGKEVFAVPGSLRNELASGPHKLIGEGCCLVQNGEDILSSLGISSAHASVPQKTENLDPEHATIYALLSHVPLPFDVLMQKMGLSSSELSSALMMMTLLGLAEEIGGGAWVKR